MTRDNTSRPARIEPLLSRAAFREAVFARDHHACVSCGRRAADGANLDAHHILERRLFPDGGYYLSNGATLCDQGRKGCHYKAETTEITVEQLRELCGITHTAIPPDFYPDTIYDKWGNEILANGRRTRGALFWDPSVQELLAPILSDFTDRVKYPRTWHLPWSPGATPDDRILADCSAFEGRDVVVTRKMDGENFSGYRDGCHARSVDGRSHPTQDWAKSFWALRSWDLPRNWRISAENLFQKHSIAYQDLPGYLLGFAIWDDRNICLAWDDTVEWFTLLDMPMVPVLYRGVFDEKLIRALHVPARDDPHHEGYVVRPAGAFHYGEFARVVGKYVRADHLGADRHNKRSWAIEPNSLQSARG